MAAESEAIGAAAARLDEAFTRAVEMVAGHAGKVVVTGVGKSGKVAAKIAATLSSTGTPGVFLHAGEAVHGDLGLYSAGDPTILISKSGSTEELLRLIPALRERGSPLVGILGRIDSPLGRLVDVKLDASVRAEADRHNLVPTASAAVSLALGDALAIAVMERRAFTPQHFVKNHPEGQLGRNLRLTVGEVMHRRERLAVAGEETPLREVIAGMTREPLGAACVVREGVLCGLITDGDLRRALYRWEDWHKLVAWQVMTRQPVTIGVEASLQEALAMMEDRASQISVLPVVDRTGALLGLLRLHDVYQARLA